MDINLEKVYKYNSYPFVKIRNNYDPYLSFIYRIVVYLWNNGTDCWNRKRLSIHGIRCRENLLINISHRDHTNLSAKTFYHKLVDQVHTGNRSEFRHIRRSVWLRDQDQECMARGFQQKIAPEKLTYILRYYFFQVCREFFEKLCCEPISSRELHELKKYGVECTSSSNGIWSNQALINNYFRDNFREYGVGCWRIGMVGFLNKLDVSKDFIL